MLKKISKNSLKFNLLIVDFLFFGQKCIESSTTIDWIFQELVKF